SQAFDPIAVKLYTTQTGSHGPAAVTLTGTHTGPVTGSLVVDGAVGRLRFVRTGGTLPADTYSLTLHSGADSLRNLTGEALDGNGDGTPGDDFQATFVVTSMTTAVSVPDFTRGPGQPVNMPASRFGLPLEVSAAGGVQSIDLTLAFDPRLLTITGALVAEG